MANSPYGRRADILRADLAIQERAFVDHASRHRCRDDECKEKQMLRATRDHFRDELARETTGSSSPAPQRSTVTTFTLLPPHLQSS
jgi:hypothetical protein